MIIRFVLPLCFLYGIVNQYQKLLLPYLPESCPICQNCCPIWPMELPYLPKWLPYLPVALSAVALSAVALFGQVTGYI